jgi:hypothetical protein
MNSLGIIRKISIGDIKEGITYKVGQEMLGGRLIIEEIIRNLDVPESIIQYDVNVSQRGSNHVRLWKSFINVPTSVEYDISEARDEDL